MKPIASSLVLPTIHLCCCIFIIKESADVYERQRMENKESGRGNRERVCIACGGHYFWRAPRLGELENIILSGWFDSAMKNVRSGDDKSWCWGEGTGRQGMSFVMSAIWLHPTPSLPLPPICLLFHISPSPSLLYFLLFCLLRRLPVSPSLSLFIVIIYLNASHCLSSLFILPLMHTHCARLLPILLPPAYINSGTVFLTL